jgi:hypothetical protein
MVVTACAARKPSALPISITANSAAPARYMRLAIHKAIRKRCSQIFVD